MIKKIVALASELDQITSSFIQSMLKENIPLETIAGITKIDISVLEANLPSFVKSFEDIPKEYQCAISQDIMTNPVVTSDGQCYEEAAIKHWLITSQKSPNTGEDLVHKTVNPVFYLQSKIKEYKQKKIKEALTYLPALIKKEHFEAAEKVLNIAFKYAEALGNESIDQLLKLEADLYGAQGKDHLLINNFLQQKNYAYAAKVITFLNKWEQQIEQITSKRDLLGLLCVTRSNPELNTVFKLIETKLEALAKAPSTGDKGWDFVAKGQIIGTSLADKEGSIYVTSRDGSVYALNPDGTKKWECYTENNLVTPPLIAPDGTVCVAINNGTVYKLNPDNGTVKQSLFLAGISLFGFNVDPKGNIYITSENGNLYVIGSDNKLKWGMNINNTGNLSPVIAADGTIYVGSEDGNLYAIHGDTGKAKWKFLTNDAILTPPVLGPDGTIYLGSKDGNIYAVDSDNGKEKWSYSTGVWVLTSPVIGPDGLVYLGSEGILHSINTETGDIKSTIISEVFLSVPVLGPNNTIYMASNDKKLLAVALDEGVVSWSYAADNEGLFNLNEIDPAMPSLVAKSGIIYFNVGNKLYAIE